MSPLPRLDATPPVTKMCFATTTSDPKSPLLPPSFPRPIGRARARRAKPKRAASCRRPELGTPPNLARASRESRGMARQLSSADGLGCGHAGARPSGPALGARRCRRPRRRGPAPAAAGAPLQPGPELRRRLLRPGRGGDAPRLAPLSRLLHAAEPPAPGAAVRGRPPRAPDHERAAPAAGPGRDRRDDRHLRGRPAAHVALRRDPGGTGRHLERLAAVGDGRDRGRRRCHRAVGRGPRAGAAVHERAHPGLGGGGRARAPAPRSPTKVLAAPVLLPVGLLLLSRRRDAATWWRRGSPCWWCPS